MSISASSSSPIGAASAPLLHVIFARHDLDDSSAISEEGHGPNKPVIRKRRILDALRAEAEQRDADAADGGANGPLCAVHFEGLTDPAPSLAPAERVHSAQLLRLFATGFDRWTALGDAGRDLYFTLAGRVTPADWSELVPSASSPRDAFQRAPSESIHAEVNYFAQDRTTPISANTAALLHHDLAVSLRAVDALVKGEAKQIYACTTQPGHHSGPDSYGGYCFVNQGALCAVMLQESLGGKVAHIDVDYHAGNGSMVIHWDRKDIFFASIHADPLISYPYTCGFSDQTGAHANVLNVPLGQSTNWAQYAPALAKVLAAVVEFGATALVVSLGVDTLLGDPEAAPLGGFALTPSDYDHMGAMVRAAGLPTIWVQEGGYKLDEAGDVVRHVLLGSAKEEKNKN